ncbi:MAG: DUF58 domain-containing protein [Bacteroidales bacterium]
MTDTADILRKVRKIEIRSRGLTDQIFTGQYHSAFKGKGMAFSEVREYNYGDAIRDIDWNVTARFNHPYVKVFHEERELTVMLLVDVSASNLTGSGERIKQERITEIAALLSFSAIKNLDKVGVIFFSDKVEKFIPPNKGAQHILLIIRELIHFKPRGNKTSIATSLRYLTNIIRKRCIAFLITDFIDENFEDALKITNKKHDLVAIRVFDPMDERLPGSGLFRFADAESGTSAWIDTASPKTIAAYQMLQERRNDAIRAACRKSGVDLVDVSTAEDYIRPFIRLFKKRGARR